MDYSSLYRKCRPKIFDDIVGQEHIVAALKNQNVAQKTGHAYLFSGTRGVGKTSAALVLAKAVNCLDTVDGNPCLKCEQCTNSAGLDIIEMDAASNNSVDDIRQLREHVKFAPTNSRKKIYIIDEVHMLSTGAFNALLKTLEEPPEYVIFILATTETHKVPETIRSRCQVFEFRRISYETIISRLEKVLGNLNISYDREALDLIVSVSEGSMRDSLSALEQCLSIDDSHLSVQSTTQILSVVGKDQLIKLLQSVFSHNPQSAITKLHHLIQGGKDLIRLNSALIDISRDLMLFKLSEISANEIVHASKEEKLSLLKLAKVTDFSLITAFFDAMLDLSKIIKYSKNKQAITEVYILRQSYYPISVEQPREEVKRVDENMEQTKIQTKPQSQKPTEELKEELVEDKVFQKPEMEKQAENKMEEIITTRAENTRSATITEEIQALESDAPLPQNSGSEILAEVMESLSSTDRMLMKKPRFALMAGNEFVIEIEQMQEPRRQSIMYKVKDTFEAKLKEITGREYRLKLVSVEKPESQQLREVEDIKEYFAKKDIDIDII